MVDGTAVVGRPDEMNCSTAICAVASCIATRSARGTAKLGTCHSWPCLAHTGAVRRVEMSAVDTAVQSRRSGGDRLVLDSVTFQRRLGEPGRRRR